MSIVGRKFLHASDIHIGFPLGSLGETGHISESDMKTVIEEMRGAFDNLIETAISENVMFLVLAGDIYDGAQAQDALQGHFQRGLERLNEAGIKVFIIHGNHDPLENQSKRRKPFPPNTKVFRPKDPEAQPTGSDSLVFILPPPPLSGLSTRRLRALRAQKVSSSRPYLRLCALPLCVYSRRALDRVSPLRHDDARVGSMGRRGPPAPRAVV